MILAEEEIPYVPPNRIAKPRAPEPDPSDREAFMVSVPSRLLQESKAVWPNWLSPPGITIPSSGRLPRSFARSGARARATRRSSVRRSSGENPPLPGT